MPKLKLSHIVLPLILSLAQPVLASDDNLPPPSACPTPAAIEAVGLDTAELFLGGPGYRVFNHDPFQKYDTDRSWFFSIFVNVEDSIEAIIKGRDLIRFLHVTEGPTYNQNEHSWTCTYMGGLDGPDPFFAMALADDRKL